VKQHLKESGERYDAVLIFRPTVAERHLSDIEGYCSKAKIIYHTSDLHFLRLQREAELENSASKLKEADKMMAHELDIFRRADATIVHSSAEAEILVKDHGVRNLHVFPWAIDIRGTERGFEERCDICFIGGYQHVPNVDAAVYFINEILPLINNNLPDVKFYAIGSNPPERLKKLASDKVVVTGYVDDLDSLIDKMRVSVAPLRYGAGIKGKVATTLSAGLPCVATAIAAEGMGLEDAENIILADTESDFANAVVDLYKDEGLWARVSLNGIYFAERMYGFGKGLRIIEEILGSVGLPYLDNVVPEEIRVGTLCASQNSR
jgi:glycosyltransferase involved in cell wall biosynthesis